MLPDQTKDVLLNPRAQISSTEISGFLTHNIDKADDNNQGTKIYMCPSICNYNVTYDNKTRCSSCRDYMNHEVAYVGNKVAENKASTNIKGGFVKDVITFMVMDDLVIQPMSTISSITLLNKFNVKEIGTLQETVVEMGMEEVKYIPYHKYATSLDHNIISILFNFLDLCHFIFFVTGYQIA
jgi:hypothetical protein